MGRRSRYSPEVKERAVRMVFEHEREYSSQWGAVTSIGPCCMDHPEGCLIMVFFNTGDNLDAT